MSTVAIVHGAGNIRLLLINRFQQVPVSVSLRNSEYMYFYSPLDEMVFYPMVVSLHEIYWYH